MERPRISRIVCALAWRGKVEICYAAPSWWSGVGSFAGVRFFANWQPNESDEEDEEESSSDGDKSYDDDEEDEDEDDLEERESEVESGEEVTPKPNGKVQN